MPYKVKKVKGGYKVTSPNHPQGFSKKPQTAREAHIQEWIIKKNTEGEGSSEEKPAHHQWAEKVKGKKRG